MSYWSKRRKFDSESLDSDDFERRAWSDESDDSTTGDSPSPRRRFPWGRLVFWTFFLSCAVGAWVGAGILTGLARNVPVLPEEVPDIVRDPARAAFGDRQRLNILCLGVDYNTDSKGIRHTKFARSDTMFVVSVSRDASSLSIVSLPRDLWVDIPGHGMDKLNAAFSLRPRGDLARAKATVERFLGLRMDHFVIIREYAAVRLIDALGGVTVDVERDMDYDDNWGNLHIHLKKGVQRLNGIQSVGYVRFRKDAEGDRGRIRRQQQFMGALTRELKQVSTLLKAEEVARGVLDNVDTNLQFKQLIGLALVYRGFDRRAIRTGKVDGEDIIREGMACIEPDQHKKDELVAQLLRDPRDHSPADVGLEILNGSDVNGAARQLGDFLQARGFRVVAVGNAPQGRSHTVIVDRCKDDKVRDELTRAIGRVEVESAPRSEGKADMTIVLGLDWREVSRALEPSPGPSPEVAAPRKKATGL